MAVKRSSCANAALPLLRQFETGDERASAQAARCFSAGSAEIPAAAESFRQELFERQPVWRLRQTFQNPRAGLRDGIKIPPPPAICFWKCPGPGRHRRTTPYWPREIFDDTDLRSALSGQVELLGDRPRVSTSRPRWGRRSSHAASVWISPSSDRRFRKWSAASSAA